MAKQEKNGSFVSRESGYAVVMANILKDASVSWRGKGLYSTIRYYITIPGFTLYKSFLERLSVDGQRAFDSAWKELQEKGYLIVHKQKGEKGKFIYMYELLDKPVEQQEEVFTDDISDCCPDPQNDVLESDSNNTGKNTHDNKSDIKSIDSECESSTTLCRSAQCSPAKRTPIIIDKEYYIPNKDNILSNHINHKKDKRDKRKYADPHYDVMESDSNNILVKTSDSSTDNFEFTEEMVREQIDYITFSVTVQSVLDGIVTLMTGILNTDDNEPVRVAGRTLRAREVKGRLLKLNLTHINYVLECLEAIETPIKRMDSYILTSLYNAPSTISMHYRNKLNVNLATG